MGQIQWTVALVSLGLFVVALIGFSVGFAHDNGSAVDISNDAQITGFNTNVQGNLTQFSSGSEGTYASIINSTISSSGQTTTSGTPFAITPVNVVGVVSNILKIGFQKIFGTNNGFEIFIITLLALIVFITAMLIWKTWGGRNPE